MPILTKSNVTKGSPAVFTLDKGNLVPLISDSYFQDTANWKIVALVYESDTGKQSEKVIFDATQVSPSSNFLISEKARDTFEIKSIMIYDFDGGYYQIPRASLSPAEFDVVLSGGGASYSLLTESTYGSFYGTSPLSLAGHQGQTFQFSTPASGQLGKVRVSMMRQGNSDAVIGMRIRNAANAIQTISSTTINHDDVALNMNGDSGQEIEFLFDNEVFNMGSNTTYKFELYCVSGTQEPVMYLGGAANTYTGGNKYDQTQGWAEDLLFAVFEKI
jgi:hypothetical protein